MTRDAIDQRAALKLQLAAIAGNEPASSLIEIRPLDPPGRQRFVVVRELDSAASLIANLASRHSVYVGACPRTRRSGTTESVERAWTLWADCDTAEAVERLRRFRPLPSIVVRSGTDGHLHAYWPLSSSIAPAHAVRANKRLARALGADRAATDAARIMRPIGSLNHKHNPPRRVEAVRVELQTFTAAQVVSGLADDPVEVPRPPMEPQRITGSGALTGLVKVVRYAIPGPAHGRNNALNWAAYRAGEHALAGVLDPVEAEAALLAAALDVGLDEHEARRTIASGLGAVTRAAA